MALGIHQIKTKSLVTGYSEKIVRYDKTRF